MKVKSLLTLIISTLVVLLSSCSKEYPETLLDSNIISDSEILVFKSIEDFQSTINKVNQMSQSELEKYEKSIGFKSFGRICDEIYYSIEPDSFKDIYEIKEFVSKNSNFITFHTDKTGDTYCLPQEFNNKERYVFNTEKMYVIGNYVYRKIEDTLVCSDIKNLTTLKNIISTEEVMNNPLFIIQKFDSESSDFAKKEQYEDDDPNGRYKLKLFIQTELFHYSLPGKWETHRETEFKITNYKKSLGIWFQSSLRTTFEIDLISYDDRSEIYRQVTASGNNVKEAVIKDSDKIKLQDGLSWDYPPYFSYYYATASNEAGCSVTFE